MTVEDVELHATLTTCDQMRAEVRYVEARTPPKQESTQLLTVLMPSKELVDRVRKRST